MMEIIILPNTFCQTPEWGASRMSVDDSYHMKILMSEKILFNAKIMTCMAKVLSNTFTRVYHNLVDCSLYQNKTSQLGPDLGIINFFPLIINCTDRPINN